MSNKNGVGPDRWSLWSKTMNQIAVFGMPYMQSKAESITDKRDPASGKVILSQLDAKELEALLLSIGIRPELIASDQGTART